LDLTYFSSGEPNTIVVVLLWAKVDWLRLGVMFALPEEMTYPSVELFYPEEERRAIVKLASKMQEHKLLPEVYLKEQKTYFDVMVIFRLTGASIEEVDEILDRRLPPRIKSGIPRAQKLEVFATGEAEINKKTTRIFKELLRRRNFFRLLILERGGESPLPAWQTQLTEIVNGLPPAYKPAD